MAHRFSVARSVDVHRYADDFSIVVKSKRAVQRVMRSITGYIETKLKLIVTPRRPKWQSLVNAAFLALSLLRPNVSRCLDAEILAFKQTIHPIHTI